MKKLIKLLTPYEVFSKKTHNIIAFGWVGIILLWWLLSSVTSDSHTFPTIFQVLDGFKSLFLDDNLLGNIFSSLALFSKAIFFSVIISIIVSYSYTLALFKPVSIIFQKFRYLPLAGISYYMAIILNDRDLQVGVLVVFVTTFLVTTLLGVISTIDEDELNHARTMGCSRWETLWEVGIKGRLDYIIDSIVQNLAIVWVMIVMIETIMYAYGGVGTLISTSTHSGRQGKVVAVQIVILIIGIGLDYVITSLRRYFLKYSKF